MYSPNKRGDDRIVDRSKIKEQKKAQLALLLVNKFRNKFSIITTSEQKIDQYVIAQVQDLLGNKDQASQNGLKALDIKLTNEIKRMREAPQAASESGKNMLNAMDARSAGARSNGSRRSAPKDA